MKDSLNLSNVLWNHELACNVGEWDGSVENKLEFLF